MLIYLLKVHSDKRDEAVKWRDYQLKAMAAELREDKESYFLHFLNDDELFDSKTVLYSVEKGDEYFGTFSYTIAGACLKDLDKDASKCELIIFPSCHYEWDDEARRMTLKSLLDKAFNELDMQEVHTSIESNDAKMITMFKNVGFMSEGNLELLSELEVQRSRVKLMVTK